MRSTLLSVARRAGVRPAHAVRMRLAVAVVLCAIGCAIAGCGSNDPGDTRGGDESGAQAPGAAERAWSSRTTTSRTTAPAKNAADRFAFSVTEEQLQSQDVSSCLDRALSYGMLSPDDDDYPYAMSASEVADPDEAQRLAESGDSRVGWAPATESGRLIAELYLYPDASAAAAHTTTDDSHHVSLRAGRAVFVFARLLGADGDDSDGFGEGDAETRRAHVASCFR
jgi:hypothetical protein